MAINRNKVLSKRDLEGEARKKSFEKLNPVLRQVQTLSKGDSIQLNLNNTPSAPVNIDWEKLTKALGGDATQHIKSLINELSNNANLSDFDSNEIGLRRLYALSDPAALAEALTKLISTLTSEDNDENKAYDKGEIAEALQAVVTASSYSVTYRYRHQWIRDAIKSSVGNLGALAFAGGLFALTALIVTFPVSLPFVGLVAALGVAGAGAVCLLGALGIKIFELKRDYRGTTRDKLSSPLKIAATSAGFAHQGVKEVIKATRTTPGQHGSENPNLIILQKNRDRKLKLLNSDLVRIDKMILEDRSFSFKEKALLEEIKKLVLKQIDMMNQAGYLSKKQIKLILNKCKTPVDKSNVAFDVNKGTLPLSKMTFLESDYNISKAKPQNRATTSPDLFFFTHSKKVNRDVNRIPSLITLSSHKRSL